MLPDRVSNPGPLTYESGALPIALRGPATFNELLATNQLFTVLHFTKTCLKILKSVGFSFNPLINDNFIMKI